VSLSPGWRRLLRLSFGRRSVERDVDEELAFHLAMREEKLRRLGVEPGEAHAQAHERFGDPGKFRDECISIGRQYQREVRAMEWIESVAADFRYALRTLRRMPVFTFVATITLALGIGATSAMFTLVNSILLRPLPYPESKRLVRLIQSYPEKGLNTWGISQENIAMYRDGATDFESFSAYRGESMTMRTSGGPIRVSGLRVTGDFFKVLRVNPAIGRPFTREEDVPGPVAVAILSHGFWQTQFGGNPHVLGTTIDFDGQPVRVIGVMAQGFGFPRADVKFWIPMGLDPNRTFGFMNAGVGRLKPDVSIGHVRTQTTTIMWDWARRRQQTVGVDPAKTQMATIVTPLHEAITGRSSRPLTVLFAAVSLILLIATANVATLLSSRAAARQREIGLRTALGATSGRVLRQLMTESVALALIGAVVGVTFAVTAVRLFTHSKLAALPRIDEVSVDGRVLGFTLLISVVSGVLFGLLPAFHSARTTPTSDLSTGQRESSHRASRRINNTLVVGQLGLSVILLVAAGLVLKSFQRLTSVTMGFRTENIMTVALALPARINTGAAMPGFVATMLEQVQAVPGVRAASLSWSLPFQGNSNVDGYLIDGRPVPSSGAEEQVVQTGVSPGHFATLGIPLLHGRDFAPGDDSLSLPVAVIDETLARKHWPTPADAIGKRIRTTGDTTRLTIVGVVGAVRDFDATNVPRPHMYVSLAQSGGQQLTLAVQTNTDAPRVIPALRAAIARVEPSMPLDDVRMAASFVDQSLATRRLTQILLGAFALLAVVLAGVGIYGVMSLYVANRKREFGIRLAIGAEPKAVVRLVLREGAILASLGVGLGVMGALGATRWLQTLLYEVSPTDPVVYVSLSSLLGAIAVMACYLPAKRAARSDPLAVLRAE
jgi:putative ABC transport system permease protein